MSTVRTIPAGAWHESVASAIGSGARFTGAWATTGGDWRVALTTGHRTQVLIRAAPGSPVESITDLTGAAVWDEREAHDLYGVQFTGSTDGERSRALVDHRVDLGHWTTPVSGAGVHQVAVGPIHAGVIESGHFRFHCVGDRILVMDPQIFHKHRGLERAAEGTTVEHGLEYIARACAACSVAHSVAYAHAVEEALGVFPDPKLRRQRTVLIELERVYNHLNDIGAICAGVGFATGTMLFATFKDRAQELCRAAFGHRFLFGTVAVGEGRLELDGRGLEALRDGLHALRADAAAAWRDLEFAASLQSRLAGVGVLSRTDALLLGTVGPAARASGVTIDARVGDPRLECPGFVAAAPPRGTGDACARMLMRAVELDASWALLAELLSEPLRPGTCHPRDIRHGGVADDRPEGGTGRSGGSDPPGRPGRPGCTDGSGDSGSCQNIGARIGVGRTESPRGESACMVELEGGPGGGRITRLHLRSASYANWPSLAHATAGNLLPDFPLINKSFELCYACVDR